ncbi:hypothetical protein ACGFNV_43490 [Streptomyces sp. NPDC048751]|uniref:hypothetical protein n=1 Tax=Streptomyces sp. NPDC048751 TaxID=3365591 RepID=UPI0037141E74
MSVSAGRVDDPPLRRTFRHAALTYVALATALAGIACTAGCASSSAAGEDGHSVTRTLRTLLPQGDAGTFSATGVEKNEPLAPVILTYKDAKGVGLVSASVGRLPVPVPEHLSGCPDPSEHPYSRCSLTHLENGATLILDTSPVDEAQPSAGQRWTAVRTDQDGSQIAVSASNTRNNKDAASSRPTPPLDERQLTDIAVSAAWKPVVAALPAPPRDPSPAAAFQSLPAEKVTEVVSRSIPHGLRTADRGGAPGYGHLTVDDGAGKCLVAVTVQRWKPDDPALESLFEGAVRNPDGTRVKSTRSHPEKGGEGAVEWSVDTWRPDGLRIAVIELNAKAYKLPGTRRTPALGVDQLKRIALSEAWRDASADE